MLWTRVSSASHSRLSFSLDVAMSGFEVAAAAIGMTDVAFRSINAIYNSLRHIKDAPSAIKQLRDELGAVIRALSGFEFLHDVNQEVQHQMQRVGLPEAITHCEASCKRLEKDLVKWTKSSDGLVARLQYLRHREQVHDCLAQIEKAKATITMGVGIAMLLVGTSQDSRGALVSDNNSTAPSQDLKRDQVVALVRHETQSIPSLAETQIQNATSTGTQLAQIAENLDEADTADDAEAALRFVQQRRAAWEQLWANSLATVDEVQALAQIDVAVGDILLDATSTNQIGVPKKVIDKIGRANIKTGNVTAKDGSTNRVGVF